MSMNRRLLDAGGSLVRPVGGGDARTEDAVLAQRVRTVLETPPGTIPWRPSFGCNLRRFVNQPLTSDQLGGVRQEIRGALTRWLPDVRVVDVKVEVLTPLGTHSARALRELPIAERALVQLGAYAVLDVDIELRAGDRPVFVQARIRP